MSGNRQALRIICLGFLLVGVTSVILKLLSPGAELAENNLQANLIRIQSFLFAPPARTILVGSSITGRLLPQYFENTEILPVANLGLDGSGPVLGLELALQRPPPVLLVEVNLLLKPWTPNDQLLKELCDSPTFRASRHVPILRANARPSSILYSWLKTRVTHGQAASLNDSSAKNRNVTEGQTIQIQTELEEVRTQIHSLVKQLHTSGCKLILMRLPAGKLSLSDDHPAVLFANKLAAEFNLPQINLAAEFEANDYATSYTDGIHLTPTAAQKASRLLATDLAKAGVLPNAKHLEPSRSQSILAERLHLKP